MIKNPFIADAEIEFQTSISKEQLIKKYKKDLGIDIKGILSSTNQIELYKCKNSGYQFFYPFNISGNSRFYEKLQEFDWYYMPWKWEHQECSNLINDGDNILEVGCGNGDFIKKICEAYKHINCTGLELNESSVTSNDRYEIVNRKIEDFSIENASQFDLVCSFQVLEHIADVNSFLKGKIQCLKESGLFVICVPNNDSFIKKAKFNILNLPPHHLGLWNEESLKRIGKEFNMRLVKIAYEPLQEHHFDWYIDLNIKDFFGQYIGKHILELINRINLNGFLKSYLRKRASSIRGHSILIIFKKTEEPNVRS